MHFSLRGTFKRQCVVKIVQIGFEFLLLFLGGFAQPVFGGMGLASLPSGTVKLLFNRLLLSAKVVANYKYTIVRLRAFRYAENSHHDYSLSLPAIEKPSTSRFHWALTPVAIRKLLDLIR